MRRQPLLLSTLMASVLATAPLAGQDIVDKMEKEHAGDESIPSPLSQTPPAAAVRSTEVSYARLEGVAIDGYLALPAEGSVNGGIILIHEWWGLNDNIRAMANRLAGEGYAALAVDLYEGSVAESREEAAALMRSTLERRERLEDNLRQAHRYLTRDAGTESVGVVGWCFGGAWSLRTALLLGDEIAATVIFYGRLVTNPNELDALQAPLLGLFGELDGGIPVETVRAFEGSLKQLGKNAEIHVYPDADHAFANPTGNRYNAKAAHDAWSRTLAFFGKHLR